MARTKPFFLNRFFLKRLLRAGLTSFGLSFAGMAVADNFQVSDIAGGLNDATPANLIGDNEASSISNFHVNPISHGLDQRRGSSKQNSTQLSGNVAVDIFSHVKSDGTSYLISVASRTISYSTSNGATWTTLVTSMTNGAVWDFASFVDDSAYGTNQTDGGWAFNGTGFVPAGSMPAAKFLEPYQNRLFAANTSAFPYRVFFSGLLQASTWTTSTDYFDMPESVVGIGQAFDGGLPIYTANSVWMLRGSSPNDFYLQQISGNIGAADNRDIKNFEIGGTEYQVFLSLGPNRSRNTIYGLLGNRLVDLGQKIPVLMSGVSIFDSSARTHDWDTSSDFSLGTASNTLRISNTAEAVQSYTPIDDFSDGDFSASPAWTTYDTSGSAWSISSNRLLLTGSGGNPYGGIYTPISNSTGAWTFTVNISSPPGTNARYGIQLSSFVPTGVTSSWGTGCFGVSSGYQAFYFNSASPGIYLAKCNAGSFSVITSSAIPAISSGTHTFEVQRTSSSVWALSFDGINLATGTDSSITNLSYLSAVSRMFTVGDTVLYDDFKYFATSGTFTSDVRDGGATITSWDVFACQTSGGSGQNFYYRTDASASSILSDAWTAIACGADIAGSSRYIQWRDDFSVSVATNFASLDRLTINYTQSSGSAQPGDMEVWNNDLWMTYTSTSSSYNSSIILMNNQAKFSTLTGLTVYGFATHNRQLLAGTSLNDGVNGGYVRRLDVGTTDDGAAVTSSVAFKAQEFSGDNQDWVKNMSGGFFNYGVSVGTFTATISEDFSDATQNKTVDSSIGNTVGRYQLQTDPGTSAKQMTFSFSNSFPGFRLQLFPPLSYYFSKQKVIPPQ